MPSAMVGRDTGVTFEVANDASRARMVRFTCVSVGDAPCLVIAPTTVLVPAKGSGIARLVLDPALGARTPGVYVSYILAIAGRDTARREVVVSVDRRSPLAFLGTAWTVRVVRKVPGLGGVRPDTTRLPLPADVDTTFLQTRVTLAALTGPQGAVAYVRRAGPIATLDSDMAGLPVVFTGLTTDGDYTGSLTLEPGAADGKVALTVRVTDWWVWPAAAILVGIVLAYLLQRYTTVERAYLTLKADVLRTASQWEGAQQRYLAALRPAGTAAPSVQYALGVDFLKQCAALLGDVDALGKPFNSPLDAGNTAYAAAQQRLAQLRACLTSWPAFADEISALTASLDVARTAATALKATDPATMPSADTAAALAAAARLQSGGPIGVANLASARADVTGMTAFLGQWTTYARRVIFDRSHATALAPRVTAAHQATFEAARAGIADAREALRWASTAADLTARKTDETLATAEGQLAQLDAVLPALTTRTHAAVADRPVLAGLADAEEMPFQPRRDAILEAAHGATADSIRSKIRVYDVLFFLLTLLVAVATGFKSLYLGQNTFGTVADYLTAVLWGFGTKYTLDAASALIGRFFSPASAAKA